MPGEELTTPYAVALGNGMVEKLQNTLIFPEKLV